MAMLWSLAWFESSKAASVSAFAVAIDATIVLRISSRMNLRPASVSSGSAGVRGASSVIAQYFGRSDGCESHRRATSRAISRGSALGPPVMFQVWLCVTLPPPPR